MRAARDSVDSDGRRGAAPGRPAQKGRPEGSAGCLPPYPDTGEGMPRGESGSAISVALEQLRNQGLEVLLLYDRIDPWMVDHLPEFEGMSFQDVGRGQLSMPNAEGEITQQAVNDEHKPLLKKIGRLLKDRVEAVNASQRLVDSPACIVTADQDLTPQLRRMLEASGQSLPESKPILEINIDHH